MHQAVQLAPLVPDDDDGVLRGGGEGTGYVCRCLSCSE